jgi:hypothetical protein
MRTLVDTFQSGAESIVRFLSAVTVFIAGNRELVVAAFETTLIVGALGAAIVGLGATFLTLGVAISGLMTGLSALASIAAFLVTPIGAVVGSAVALVAVFTDWQSLSSQLVQSLGRDLPRVFDAFRSAVDAGEVRLALDILIETAKVKFIELGGILATELIKGVAKGVTAAGKLLSSVVLPGAKPGFELVEKFGDELISDLAFRASTERLDALIGRANDLRGARERATAEATNEPMPRWMQLQIERDRLNAESRRRSALEEERAAQLRFAREQEMDRRQRESIQRSIAQIREAQQRAIGAPIDDQLTAMREIQELARAPLELELPGEDDLLARLEGLEDELALPVADSFGERMHEAVQLAADEIRAASTFSSTEAGRTAGFLLTQKKNPNERLESLTMQQNVLMRDQLAAVKNLEVAN